jgi:uncharacterized protein YjiS (DUF1127 family)
MSTLILAAGSGRRATAGLARFALAVGTAIVREYRARREISFLMEQDDRTLHDLGISRSEVERAVRGWFR